MAETFSFELWEGRTLTLWLYTPEAGHAAVELDSTVKDAVGRSELISIRVAALAGNFQVLAAANRALQAQHLNKMKTRNIGHELLYRMSSSTNIAGSLEKFGVGAAAGSAGVDGPDAAATAVLLAAFDATAAQLELVQKGVLGKLTKTTALELLGDRALITKLYSIDAKEAEAAPLMGAIVSRIAIKQPY